MDPDEQEIPNRPEQVHEDWLRRGRARWLDRLNWLYWLDRRPAFYAALEAERRRRLENLDPYQAILKDEKDEARRAVEREAAREQAERQAAELGPRDEKIRALAAEFPDLTVKEIAKEIAKRHPDISLSARRLGEIINKGKPRK